ncbi:MAG: DUF4373 domain-containing protein [Bacteroides sp.]|nr:DUF4373 domain-containing protein [Bacteroides sp.]
MSRIRKRGLDYFPMNTDLIQNRIIRRIMKREGDAAFTVLLQTLCHVYSDEGYYVVADDAFYEDLADMLYEKESSEVRRIVEMAVSNGLFDAALYESHRVLTSADIQRQYLFIVRQRRMAAPIDERYALLSAEEQAELRGGSAQKKSARTKSPEASDTPSEPMLFASEEVVSAPAANNENAENKGINAENNPISATFKPQNAVAARACGKSKAKKSKAKESKADLLLHSSSENGGTPGGAEPGEGSAEETSSPASPKEWTEEDIARLTPPDDGRQRNLEGLLRNLREQRVPPREQYAIVLKSNFGIIGHPVWRGFITLRGSYGKIRQPGRYLLSLCKREDGG